MDGGAEVGGELAGDRVHPLGPVEDEARDAVGGGVFDGLEGGHGPISGQPFGRFTGSAATSRRMKSASIESRSASQSTLPASMHFGRREACDVAEDVEAVYGVDVFVAVGVAGDAAEAFAFDAGGELGDALGAAGGRGDEAAGSVVLVELDVEVAVTLWVRRDQAEADVELALAAVLARPVGVEAELDVGVRRAVIRRRLIVTLLPATAEVSTG